MHRTGRVKAKELIPYDQFLRLSLFCLWNSQMVKVKTALNAIKASLKYSLSKAAKSLQGGRLILTTKFPGTCYK